MHSFGVSGRPTGNTLFTIDGIQYNCVEQWMMAEKARLFKDDEVYQKIMNSPHPKAQKAFGRKIRGYDDAEWSKVRYEVVLKGTIEKYKQNPELLELLLATGDAQFVECSPMDRIWGIGMRRTDPNATIPDRWQGQNLLGKIITAAREILKQESARL